MATKASDFHLARKVMEAIGPLSWEDAIAVALMISQIAACAAGESSMTRHSAACETFRNTFVEAISVLIKEVVEERIAAQQPS